MNFAHDNVAAAVRKARDQARVILADLERSGHPQTAQSSGLYLALVGIQKRLLAADPPPVARFIPELEQIVRSCDGKLELVRPLLEEALQIARSNMR